MKTALIFWALLAAIAVACVACAAALLAFPIKIGFLPGVTAIWALAVIGSALGAIAVLGMRRQLAAIETQRQLAEDRQRRVQEYRRDERAADTLDGRREPYISDRRAA